MTIQPVTFYERPAQQLSNNHLALTVVPSLAARLMTVTTSAKNFLWINHDLLEKPKIKGWKNWGGYKTWIAPQSQWKKIDLPDEQMDQSEWQIIGVADSAAATSIELRSPLIAWAGVTLTRKITLKAGESKIYLRETMTNASKKNQSWALWGVMQFPVPGYATFPKAASKHAHKLHGKPPTFKAQKIKFTGDAKWKLGALTDEGWATYQAKGWSGGLTVQFPIAPNLPHADESNLEVWSNSDPAYMELEWLSPLTTLKPAGSFTVDTVWILTPPQPTPSSPK